MSLHSRALGVLYMLGMLVIGIVVIGMETNLADIAALCKISLQKVSIALILRSVGSLLGSFSSARLMLHLSPHYLISVVVLVMGSLLAAIPFVSSFNLISFIFLFLGYGIPVAQAAINLLTCRVFGENAGPWLQGNSLSMSVGTVLAPSLHYIEGLKGEYVTLALISTVIAFTGFSMPPPYQNSQNQNYGAMSSEGSVKDIGNPGLTRVDLCIAGMLLWLVGIIVQTTSYLKSYVEQSSLSQSVEVDLLLMTYLCFCIAGQLVALYLQQTMTLTSLHFQMSLLYGSGLFSMLAILCFPNYVYLFWCSICLYGFCVGPLYGYIFDLWNRSTSVSEVGVSVVTFGISLSGLFSYITHSIWVWTGSCATLFVVNCLGFFVAWLILLYLIHLPAPMATLSEPAHDPPNSPDGKARSMLLSSGSWQLRGDEAWSPIPEFLLRDSDTKPLF